MVLFCGNKLFRQTGTISVPEISTGSRIEKECFTVYFNDGSTCILPSGTYIQLINNKKIRVEKPIEDCFNGTKSKYRVEQIVPEFTNQEKDPYIMGIAICTPIRNGSLQIKGNRINPEKVPKEYYTFDIKGMSNGFFRITSEEGYPDLLRLDIKKQGNFNKISERFVPDAYLFSSRERREALLRGCMDLMGHHYRNETTFESSSYQLSRDVCFLVRSLGGFSKIRSKRSVKEYFIVAISFQGDFNPFLMKEDYIPSKKPRVRSIEKIEKAGILPCLSIPLDKVILENFVEVS